MITAHGAHTRSSLSQLMAAEQFVVRAWFFSAGDSAVGKTKQRKSLDLKGLEVEAVPGVQEAGVSGAE